MLFTQHYSQKISQALKVRDVNTQNLINKQLQFSENFNQIILKINEFLEESNSLINNQNFFSQLLKSSFKKFIKRLQLN